MHSSRSTPAPMEEHGAPPPSANIEGTIGRGATHMWRCDACGGEERVVGGDRAQELGADRVSAVSLHRQVDWTVSGVGAQCPGDCSAGDDGVAGVEEGIGLRRHTMHAPKPAMIASTTSNTAPTEVDAAANTSADCESLAAGGASKGGGDGLGGVGGVGGGLGGGAGTCTTLTALVLMTLGVFVTTMPRRVDAAAGENSFSPTCATRLFAFAPLSARIVAVTTTDPGMIVSRILPTSTPATPAKRALSSVRFSKS